MATQCKKKKNWQKCFAFLNAYYYPQTHLIKALNSLDSSRANGRLSQNQKKTEVFRELVLLGNYSKLTPQVNFPKKHPDFGGLETNHEIQP